MALCINTINGELCTNKANKSGYCKACESTVSGKSALELQTLEEAKKTARAEALRRAKVEQRQEILLEDISDSILEIRDIEGVRRLELKVMQGLVDGTIDSKAGSPIVQLLKHQCELLGITMEKEEKLDSSQREMALQIAIKMSPEQMLKLLGDFSHGMQNLVKEVKTQQRDILVVPKEVISGAEIFDS
jgi:hypothetical protein